MKRFAVCVAVVLMGCAESRSVQTPSGHPGVQISCLQTRETCLSEIGDFCGAKGFHIVSESSRSGTPIWWYITGWWAYGEARLRTYDMQAECGNPHLTKPGYAIGIAPDGSRVVPIKVPDLPENPWD